MENNTGDIKKVEVVYDKAPLSKRMLSYFFDVSIFLLTTLIFFTILNPIVNATPMYKAKENELTALRVESHLYVDDQVVTKFVDESDEFNTSEEKKDYLRNCIDAFYASETFFKDSEHITLYNQRKESAKVDGVNMFIYDETNNLKENSVAPAYLYSFYKDEVDHYCLGYLLKNPKYFELTRFDFWKVIVEIIISATIFYLILFLVLPLTCFKRGRCTIGMKLARIGLININALTVKKLPFCLRTLFNYLIFVYINIALFLIPTFVSIGMVFLSKTNQSLTNYFFNDYFVDTSNQHIYLDEGERQFSKINLSEVSIENKDFVIK